MNDDRSVRLRFVRERKPRKAKEHPFYVEITFPLAMKPKLLPDEGEVQLYPSAYMSERERLARFEFRLAPRDVLEEIGAAETYLTIVGVNEICILMRGGGETMPAAWKARKTKIVYGVLEDKDDAFTITFSQKE